eukprot:1148161-Pelagomonas_calceolata.AAC.3
MAAAVNWRHVGMLSYWQGCCLAFYCMLESNCKALRKVWKADLYWREAISHINLSRLLPRLLRSYLDLQCHCKRVHAFRLPVQDCIKDLWHSSKFRVKELDSSSKSV